MLAETVLMETVLMETALMEIASMEATLMPNLNFIHYMDSKEYTYSRYALN